MNKIPDEYFKEPIDDVINTNTNSRADQVFKMISEEENKLKREAEYRRKDLEKSIKKHVEEQVDKIIKNLPKDFAKNRCSGNPRPWITINFYSKYGNDIDYIVENLNKEGFMAKRWNMINDIISIRDPSVPINNTNKCCIL